MNSKKRSFGEKHPQFAQYVVNPNITDGPTEKRNVIDVLTDIYEEEDIFPENVFDAFCHTITSWDLQFMDNEPAFRYAYDIKNTSEANRNTYLLKYAISSKLQEMNDRMEGLNFLYKIQKDLSLGEFFPGLPFDDSIHHKVDTEIKFLEKMNGSKETSGDSNIGLGSKGLSVKYRVLLLDELGIIEHLKNRYALEANHNKIARLLSPIFEANSDTIRKYIDALKNPNSTNKKNAPSTLDNKGRLHTFLADLKVPIKNYD